jgi:aminoglycoside phosphotransferase (APT) family kinase protein
VDTFDPTADSLAFQQVLARSLGADLHLVRAEPLTKSSRDAPWRLDVEVGGSPRSYVLRIGSRNIEHEYLVLRAMESLPLPAPRAFGWDPGGEALGAPSFFTDFVEGESLLQPMLSGEPWAEDLFLDTVCALQAVTWEAVRNVAGRFGSGVTAADVLEEAHDSFQAKTLPLAGAVYTRLKETMPPLPDFRFSNGDLWPDNLIVRDKKLAGVIDWEHAGFSDPIFELLLPFFVAPELRGRGLEERYCRRMGFDPAVLPWYHALEYYDTWHWVEQLGEPFEQYTAGGLSAALARWLDGGDLFSG